MMSSIDINIEFVSASQGGGMQVGNLFNSINQTGDAVTWLIVAILIIAMFCLLAMFTYFRKKRFSTNSSKLSDADAMSVQNLIGAIFKSIFKSITLVVIVSLVVAALIVAGLSNAFSTLSYADNNSALVPSTNKITATVEDDGTISCSQCNLTNSLDSLCRVSTSFVNVNEEAKNVNGISDLIFSINGFDGIIFEGAPDGSEFTTKNLTPLQSGDSTELMINIRNLSKESALALCGKSIFGISLIPVKVFNVSYEKGAIPGASINGEVPIDDNFYDEGDKAVLKDNVSLASTGYTFSGWTDSVGGETYQVGDACNITSDTIFYAK